MNALVPLSAKAVSAVFQSMANLPDMNAAAQANVAASFSIVGYRGKNWRVKYRGEEKLVMDSRGVPDSILDVVIVGISPNISKQFYDKKYTEGDDGAPDCFSVDGVTPDAASPKKQCEACAVCPQNVWGSRITEAGKKAKACQDSRRMAVVPRADIVNADYGGPMMLRIPPMSIGNLMAYSKELARFGAQPFMVETRLAFDHQAAYPQITFQATGWIDDEDSALQIKDAIEDPQIERMLSIEVAEATHDVAEPTSALAGGAPATVLATQPTTIVQPVVTNTAVQTVAPTTVAATTPIKRKTGGFNTGPATPEPAAQPAQTAPVQQAAPVVEAQPEPAATLQPAPTDMESAIDDLLAS